MSYVILVTMLLLLQLFFFSFRAGQARGKGDVSAPAMTGDEYFERCSRVHLNTLEQLMMLLPAMWICAAYFSADVAAILGAVFLIARFIYSQAYLKAANRAPGMVIGVLATVSLIFCNIFVAVRSLL